MHQYDPFSHQSSDNADGFDGLTGLDDLGDLSVQHLFVENVDDEKIVGTTPATAMAADPNGIAVTKNQHDDKSDESNAIKLRNDYDPFKRIPNQNLPFSLNGRTRAVSIDSGMSPIRRNRRLSSSWLDFQKLESFVLFLLLFFQMYKEKLKLLKSPKTPKDVARKIHPWCQSF